MPALSQARRGEPQTDPILLLKGLEELGKGVTRTTETSEQVHLAWPLPYGDGEELMF